MTPVQRLLVAVLALAMLGACGSDRSEPGAIGVAVGSIAKTAVDAVKQRRAGKGAAKAPPTREELEKLGKPVTRFAVETRALDAMGSLSDQKGAVQTWAVSGGLTFSLRDGVLIQSRGLGADLMSAQVPSLGQLTVAGTTYQREYFFLGQDDAATRRTYDCVVSSAKKDEIEVYGRSYTTVHVTEDCAWKYGKIKNQYWIDGATVRRSRQWMSGFVGYIAFERIVD